MDELFSGFNSATKQDWLDQIQKDLKDVNFEKLTVEVDGINIQPFYTKDDLPVADIIPDEEDDEIEEDFEGEETQLAWSACEEITFGAGDSAADLFAYAAQNSVRGLRVSGDTDNYIQQLGKTFPVPVTLSIHPENDLAEEDVVKRWRNYLTNLAQYESLLWSIEFDPIAVWSRNGRINQANRAFNNLAEIYLRLQPRLHNCRLIKIDVSQVKETSTATEQLAYALSLCTEYFDQLSERQVAVEDLMHNIVFRFPVFNDFFIEIAKLRAFKLLWENFIRAWLPDHDFILPPSIHCVTALGSYTEDQRHTNLIRTTTEAMSAILGGCEVLSILPFDNTENEFSKRLASNIHHLLRYESYLDKYAKAAAGSFYIENLTNSLAQKSWEMFKNMQANGGILNAGANVFSNKMFGAQTT